MAWDRGKEKKNTKYTQPNTTTTKKINTINKVTIKNTKYYLNNFLRSRNCITYGFNILNLLLFCTR